MLYLVYAIHVFVCIFLILVVLLQQGKGADLSVFGGGSTQTAFGAVGATSLLHKLTVGSFILFILTTMVIAVTQNNRRGDSTVLSGSAAVTETVADEEQPATSETGATEAASDTSSTTGGEAGQGGDTSTQMEAAPDAADPGEAEGAAPSGQESSGDGSGG